MVQIFLGGNELLEVKNAVVIEVVQYFIVCTGEMSNNVFYYILMGQELSKKVMCYDSKLFCKHVYNRRSLKIRFFVLSSHLNALTHLALARTETLALTLTPRTFERASEHCFTFSNINCLQKCSS